jgi:hypothetical protein
MTHDQANDEYLYWLLYKQKYSHMSQQSLDTVNDRIRYLDLFLSTTANVTAKSLSKDHIIGWSIVAVIVSIVVISVVG